RRGAGLLLLGVLPGRLDRVHHRLDRDEPEELLALAGDDRGAVAGDEHRVERVVERRPPADRVDLAAAAGDGAAVALEVLDLFPADRAAPLVEHQYLGVAVPARPSGGFGGVLADGDGGGGL